MSCLFIHRKYKKTEGGAVNVPCNILQQVEIDTKLYDWVHFIAQANADENTQKMETPYIILTSEYLIAPSLLLCFTFYTGTN